jgi:hypothetical protein
MRWAELVACMRNLELQQETPVGRNRCCLEYNIKMDRKGIWGVKVWAGFNWLKIEISGEHGDEFWDSIQAGNFLTS